MWRLTEEQRLIQDSAQKLLQSEYDFEQRKQRLSADAPYSDSLWQQFAELGWLGIAFAERDGGYGGDVAELTILMHAFGQKLVVEPYLATVILGGEIVARGAQSAVRSELLARLMQGQLQLAVALAEPGSRYDLNRVTTRAVRQTDGTLIIDGAKAVVLNALSADYLVIPARTAGADDAEGGITLFLVPSTAPGVQVSSYRLNDGQHGGDVQLRGVHMTTDGILGEVDGGFELLDWAVDRATVAACAEAVGAMDQVMEMTIEYLRTREQFGSPIGTNQALKFRMVEMHYALEESRSMVSGAIAAMESESEPAARRAAVSAMKVKAGQSARLIGQEGVQLHGAIGMTEDYAVGHYYKRLESLRLLFGDPDHHLARYGRWRRARN